MLSGSKELEPGVRAMLVLADGLFRLDVAIRGDTLRAVVRNLSNGALQITSRPGRDTGASLAFGEVVAYQPGRTGIEFTLGSGDDRVRVEVTIATLRFPERGTLRVTAQALLRQEPAAEAVPARLQS